jgi:hypothetical protein
MIQIDSKFCLIQKGLKLVSKLIYKNSSNKVKFPSFLLWAISDPTFAYTEFASSRRFVPCLPFQEKGGKLGEIPGLAEAFSPPPSASPRRLSSPCRTGRHEPHLRLRGELPNTTHAPL